MYESTSQASPRFDANSASGIDVGFNGALDLLRTWRDAARRIRSSRFRGGRTAIAC